MSVDILRDGPTLWVTINRESALNAIDYDVMAGLEGALDTAEADESIRVFVLRGAGNNAFASGGDLRKFSTLDTAEKIIEMSSRMVHILRRIEELHCWTIAHINGDAYGGGCETTLAFDLRIARPGALLGFTQAKFYVTPGWGGLTRLVEAVGRSRALYWLATATTITVEQALVVGLIHEVVDEPEARIRELITELAQHDVDLVTALKRGAERASDQPHTHAIRGEMAPFVDVWLSEEHQRRIDAFLDRSKSKDSKA